MWSHVQRTDPKVARPRLDDEARWFRAEDRDADERGTAPPSSSEQQQPNSSAEPVSPHAENHEAPGQHRPGPPSEDSWLKRLTSVKDWRVRNKLIAVVLIPTTAFLVLAGINLFNLVSTAQEAADDAAVAAFARDVNALAHDLQEERDIAAGFAVIRDEPSGQAYGNQQIAVDGTLATYNDAEGGLYDEASALLQVS